MDYRFSPNSEGFDLENFEGFRLETFVGILRVFELM